MMKIIRSVEYTPCGTSPNYNKHRTCRFDHLGASQGNLCSSLIACGSTLWISSVQVNKSGIFLEFTFVCGLKGEKYCWNHFFKYWSFFPALSFTLAFCSSSMGFWERMGEGKTKKREKVMNKKGKGRKYEKNMLETYPSTYLCARKIKRNLDI